MRLRVAKPVALGMLFCIAVLVVSPVVDLPLTAIKAVRADLHTAQISAPLSLTVLQLPGRPASSGFFGDMIAPDHDVLGMTLSYRC